MTSPANVQATYCATLVDEWVRGGVRHAVISPGSRSTPLALALAADDRLTVHVHHDERAAGFLALGIGRGTGVPAVVLTTSGSAAVHLHPAVIEASYGGVPMLACTADRPPELQSVGAPQTIDQAHLFGRAVRWFAEPGVADAAVAHTWRSLASRAVAEATGLRPGPVHLNLAFREPLVGEAGELPPGRRGGRTWHEVPAIARTVDADLAPVLNPRRGVLVAGGGIEVPWHVVELAQTLNWPVLADPRSGCRPPGPATVAAFDALLRDPSFAEAHRPEVVVRLGEAPASKVLNQWVAASGADEVVVAPAWLDPDRGAAHVVRVEPSAWCRVMAAALDARTDDTWRRSWVEADARAQAAIGRVLADHEEPTEPFVARTVAAEAEGTLVVASSMPVRDVEWYAAPRGGLRVVANRGANGIDGVVSTAAGIAAGTGEPVTVLVGDVAFLHDSNALLGLADRGLDLTIVVVDNRGGGIFSFLPQAGSLPAERFEQLFGTPHEVDLPSLAAVHGVPAFNVHVAEGLVPALRAARAAGGTYVVVVRTDRHANVAVHDEVHAAVAAALR
ncbi:MAG: 2-succinyl-5-enolpyruvyl-6-hydroxy-3-cyclohexene-carboxylate synthase [Acidimicrobiales bacterium]|nr:2-succinyl-5-enolpyruvyl-6-hydroxy-3-cyclohexene-carboxylate synthase [Acidimicrobiales bacterium]